MSAMAPLPRADGPVSVNLDVPARALAVAAHPDDVEFGCGGTLAKWAAAGCRIHHLVCTDGSKGSWDPDEDTAELVTRRRAEQRDAARTLGGDGEVVFLDQRDGELEPTPALRAEIAYWIRRLQPDVVLGHDPWRRYRLHPVAPAGPAAEGQEVLTVVRIGRMRIAMRIFAEELRRIVVHRLGSSLWVLMVRYMRAGSVHLFERKPNNEFSIPSALEWLLSVATSRPLASTSHSAGPLNRP